MLLLKNTIWCEFLPRRSDRRAGWGCCDVVRGCTMLSDCGTSHRLPYRSAESSPVRRQACRSLLKGESWILNRSFSFVGCGCSYLRVDAEVLPGGKSESQEVVALSCFFSVKLHQLPQLLHNLIGKNQTHHVRRRGFERFFLFNSKRKLHSRNTLHWRLIWRPLTFSISGTVLEQ